MMRARPRNVARALRPLAMLPIALVVISIVPISIHTTSGPRGSVSSHTKPHEAPQEPLIVHSATRNVTRPRPRAASPARAGEKNASSESRCTVRAGTAPNAADREEGLSKLRDGRAAILYLHVFKSGGTSVCSAFADSNWRTPPTSIQPDGSGNCNLPPGFTNGTSDDARDEPASWLRKVTPTWQFVGLEFEGLPSVPSSIPSPRCAVWAVQLRDPRNRMLSHFYVAQAHFRCFRLRECAKKKWEGFGQAKHGWARRQDSWSDANNRPLMSLDGGADFGETNVEKFVTWYGSKGGKELLGPRHPLVPLMSGDFMARHLCGFDACAAGDCDDSCLDVAKERLETLFALILITETLDAWGWRALQGTVGLKIPRVFPHRAGRADPSETPGCSALGCRADHMMDPLSEVGELMLRLFDLDLRLYAFAVDLAAQRYKEFGARPRVVSSAMKCEGQVVKDLRAKSRGQFTVSAFGAAASRCGLNEREADMLLANLLKRQLIADVASNRFSKEKRYLLLEKRT